MVAPLAGAWIEIENIPSYSFNLTSLPSRERGLKLERCSEIAGITLSLPSRERGLKLFTAV